MSQVGSRKRPAPGTSPYQISPSSLRPDPTSPTPAAPQAFSTPSQSQSGTDSLSTSDNAALIRSAAMPNSSVQLARRRAPQDVVAQTPFANATQVTQWPGAIDTAVQPQGDPNWKGAIDEQKLDQEAEEAMQTAKRNRRSIPPFVLKLRSFLDDSRDANLIRWSESGNSFVVLEEEEFARTLIPELFKHANYASFVRQLNMYGFHKKVGLSDNSMRASERKNKRPSEYSNPFFRRGRPNLMWLIQKPKTPHTKTRAGGRGKPGDGQGDEDDDGFDVEQIGGTGDDRFVGLRGNRQPLLLGESGTGLPEQELSTVHNELRLIRQQHQLISSVIQKLRRDHETLYQQAAQFQELHNRHENSINAILTFLATVYNRSLEDHAGPNMANMFPGALPRDMPQQGSVVDVGDIPATAMPTSNAMGRTPGRRQPLLLHAPPESARGSVSTPVTGGAPSPASPNASTHPSGRSMSTASQTPQNKVEELSEHTPSASPLPDAATPATTSSTAGLTDGDILSMINSANAQDASTGSGNRLNFPQALSHLQTADGQAPLSEAQRNGVLQLMANGNRNGGGAVPLGSANNALVTPQAPAVPDMENWNAANADLAFLEKTLKEQEDKMSQVSSMLQPYSPSGTIPGLHDAAAGAVVPPSDGLDFDQIFNTQDYFGDAATSNFDFGADSSALGATGNATFDSTLSADKTTGSSDSPKNGDSGSTRTVETVNNSANASPEATTPTAEASSTGEAAASPRKRQRKT